MNIFQIKKQNLLLIFMSSFLLLFANSSVFALAPIGAPRATLKADQWNIGLDYSSSEFDLKLKDIQGTSFFTRDKAKDVEMKNTFAKLALGINDNWEVSVDFGISKSEYKERISWMDGSDLESALINYESDTGFAGQIGTKVTLYENGPIALGALFQAGWATLDGDYYEASWTNNVFNDDGTGELDADIMIFKFAPGVSFTFHDDFDNDMFIYGGPLWQWIDGDGTADGQTGSALGEVGKGDIEHDSLFGGWIGFQANLSSDMVLNYEFQVTDSSNTYGFSLVKKF